MLMSSMPGLEGEDAQSRNAVIEELRSALRGQEMRSEKKDDTNSRGNTQLRCRFEAAKSLGKLKANGALDDLKWMLAEERIDLRVMQASAWAIQEITGQMPPVGLPQPRSGDWIIKDY